LVTKGIAVLGGGVGMEGPWITPWELAKCQAVVPLVAGTGPRPRMVGLDGREGRGDIVVIDRIGRICLADW
jgi:hypothetical protein